MEKASVNGCSSCSVLRKGADVTPNPSTWESLSDLCWDVYNCLNSTGPCGKRLIVHFSLPGTQIHIDIGNVKAAGVLCVLGISLGLGTYVLYKIYDRYIRPSSDRKPKSSDSCSSDDEAVEDEQCQNTGQEEMGNQQSSPVDIPVYYKAGFGVSLFEPVKNPKKLRNRKRGAKYTQAADTILTGNIRQRNGLVAVENSNCETVDEVQERPVKNRTPDLSQLRIQIDESGFVDEDGVVNDNIEKLSLKGNFSPTSLHEKNLRFGYEPDLETDGFRAGGSVLNDAFLSNSKGEEDSQPNVIHTSLGSTLKSSSVLLTPPPEDENTSTSHVIHPNSPQISRNSTKSDISEIRSEIAEEESVETDDEREEFSPLPFDRSSSIHSTPEKLCPEKLKLKLGQIISHSSSRSASSSDCTSPESSNDRKRTVSFGFEKENSISGVSSPELELLNSENTDVPVVNSGAFIQLEDEIHTVEGEFESLSHEIQELTNKYKTYEFDQGSEILKQIFLRYPSIRIRQSERGVYYNISDTEGDSRHNSEMVDDDRDLSWDLENVMDMMYSESSELESAAKSLQERLSKVENETLHQRNSAGNTSSLSNNGTYNSVNCSVDLGGSMYEDEFHLHLGTKALPSIEEQSPNPKDCDHNQNESSSKKFERDDGVNNGSYDADCSSSLQTDNSKVASSENGSSDRRLRTSSASSCDKQTEVKESKNESQNEVTAGLQTGLSSESQTGANINGSKDFQGDQRSEIETDSPHSPESHSSNSFSQSKTDTKDLQKDTCTDSESSSVYHDGEDNFGSPVVENSLCSIGERKEVAAYADSEWKGDTPRAQRMREAYRAIPNHCQCCHLRRIRGDNYCGIRGALFQTLVNSLPPFHIWASKEQALRSLDQAFSSRSSGMPAWNFANRISYTADMKLEVMQRCLSTLYAKIEEMKQHSGYTDREQAVVDLLNSDPSIDLDLMEGVKLLMLLSAIRLRNDMEQGRDVPVFAWLMFARDTSETLSSFVKNHLNQVGDSCGLEQVEMCLLGYSLGVRIRVFRLQQFSEEDFISYYPEDGTESWPVVSLIAEDDRHYNVPVL